MSQCASIVNDVGIEARFLTPRDVAALLNVCEAQVYALMRRGELPAIKHGGRGVWRVDVRQLESYIERLHDETAEWAKANPLNPRDDEAPIAAAVEGPIRKEGL